MSRKAFTLIELLVVIAIIAILSVVVILTLNPAQLLQQSRDSNRISDMSTLNSALGIYLAQGGSSLGNANTVYVSIPDPTATSSLGDQCQGLGLISLPLGYTYQCAATSTSKNVNGTGWIPMNFNSLAAGSPLGSIPTDPTNTTSSRLYYAYATNGSQYEVTMVPESQKYQLGGSSDVISSDGGTLASVYEKGSKVGLEPLDYGDPTLIGLWTFNEGTGTVAYDYSGNNATGSWSGTLGNQYSTNAKIGPYAGNFDGSTNYVNASDTALDITGNTISFGGWVYPTIATRYQEIVGNVQTGVNNRDYALYLSSAGTSSVYLALSTISGLGALTLSMPWQINAWNDFFVTYNGSTVTVYLNGASVYSTSASGNLSHISAESFYIGADPGYGYYTNGFIDDVRVYDRALTANQVAALYAGGK